MEQLIFSKYSNERSRRFAIRTDIIQTDAGRYVKKTALYPEGKAHIEALIRKEEVLAPMYAQAGWKCNHGELLDDSVRLDHETGETLEARLDALLAEDRAEQAKQELTEFLYQLKRIHEKEPFRVTEEFRKVFGEIPFPEHYKALCAEAMDIDLVCQNLICPNGEDADGSGDARCMNGTADPCGTVQLETDPQKQCPVVLDYEWTFFFPIPCNYLLYRVIHYFLDVGEHRKQLSAEAFYQEFSISEAERGLYEQMERSFQRYLVEGMTPMRELFSDMTPGICSLRKVTSGKLQVFYEKEGTYLPEYSCTIPLNNWMIDEEIPIPSGCRTIRLDPCEEPCMVRFEDFTFDGKSATLTGAGVPEGNLFQDHTGDLLGYFYGKDPAIFFLRVPEQAKKLKIRARIYPTPPEAVLRAILKEQQAQQQEQQIRAMEGTKVWKLYRRYRDVREKK